jgi:hypothetical protein
MTQVNRNPDPTFRVFLKTHDFTSSLSERRICTRILGTKQS